MKKREEKAMKEQKKLKKDLFITIGILTLAMAANVFKQYVLGVQLTTPSIFLLAVFTISRYTTGYVYGVIASLISTFLVNFAFIFPYFQFDFFVSENIITTLVMLCVSIKTSIMTTQLKEQETIRVETEKEKMRSNLLRAISHDLRTPLTTIYGSCSVLLKKEGLLSKNEKEKLLHGMQEDAQWLIDMVENLLMVTKIENNDMKLKKIPVVLEELIDSVMVKFRKRHPQQQVQILIPDEFIMIPMDAVLITQVLVNILDNAVEHAEGMKNLMLSVDVCEEKAYFRVLDDGCGIAKERLKNIFEGNVGKRYGSVDGKKHDMGIGLSVCESIIKAHKGDIRVYNLEQGGCCFEFTLKMEDEENE